MKNRPRRLFWGWRLQGPGLVQANGWEKRKLWQKCYKCTREGAAEVGCHTHSGSEVLWLSCTVRWNPSELPSGLTIKLHISEQVPQRIQQTKQICSVGWTHFSYYVHIYGSPAPGLCKAYIITTSMWAIWAKGTLLWHTEQEEGHSCSSYHRILYMYMKEKNIPLKHLILTGWHLLQCH